MTTGPRLGILSANTQKCPVDRIPDKTVAGSSGDSMEFIWVSPSPPEMPGKVHRADSVRVLVLAGLFLFCFVWCVCQVGAHLCASACVHGFTCVRQPETELGCYFFSFSPRFFFLERVSYGPGAWCVG